MHQTQHSTWIRSTFRERHTETGNAYIINLYTHRVLHFVYVQIPNRETCEQIKYVYIENRAGTLRELMIIPYLSLFVNTVY